MSLKYNPKFTNKEEILALYDRLNEEQKASIEGQESKVKEYLDADIKNSDLSEYVSQVLIPTEKVYQVRNGKKIEIGRASCRERV